MAGERHSVENARQGDKEFPLPLERADKRRAIVDTARAIARQKGFEAVTLMAVAEAMGFAPATVYGYFATKQELLAQLSCDEEATEIVPDTPAALETAKPNGDQASAADPHDAHYAHDAMLRDQAAALDTLAKRILVPKGQAREGTDVVLARLETRLHVIEQSYAESDKRRAEEQQALQQQLIEQAQAVREMQSRIEQAESRNQAAFSELRLSLFNLEHPDVGEAKVTPPPEDDAGFVFVPEEPAPPPHRPTPNPTRSIYLSSARSAAMSAPVAPEAPWWRKFLPDSPLRVATLALLLVAGVAVGAWRMMPEAPTLSTAALIASSAPAKAKQDRLTARAEAGDAAAALVLGVEWLDGTGRTRDPAKAGRWLKRAAAAGQPMAQNYLGVLYRTGVGVEASKTEAARWFEMAALQGNRPAMANLGKLYAGWDRKGHYAVAARWFVRAASFGDADSAFNLAVLYERGAGLPQSLFDAYKWYAIAAAQGDQPAAARTRQLSPYLEPDERRAATALAQAFEPLPVEAAANRMPS